MLAYNQQVCINLVNQHGSEGRLEKFYSELLEKLNEPMIRLIIYFFILKTSCKWK